MNSAFIVILLILKLHPLGFVVYGNFENYYIENYLKEVKKTQATKSPYHPEPLSKEKQEPSFHAAAYMSVDLKSNKVLTAKNTQERRQVASLTKLMTAYLVLKDLPLDKVIDVNLTGARLDDATTGLSSGEQITVHNALKALLINSGSDAAISLAHAHSGSVDAFVIKMNETASSLGLLDTSFSNPVGWDSPQNYSTAEDMIALSRILLRNDDFKDIIKQKYSTITTTSGRRIDVASTNQLLGENGYLGLKTGYTYQAGECLVSYYDRDDKEVLTLIIGSTNRFGETRKIIDWIFSAYLW